MGAAAFFVLKDFVAFALGTLSVLVFLERGASETLFLPPPLRLPSLGLSVFSGGLVSAGGERVHRSLSDRCS